ncbi:hypothetical protein TIFTF001_023304 [Ficus carica]|uniref:SWIM-type domain-containing protein n=1 Tax=Ficus carica TaxID=3494 RepID=A0AA88DK57_FICCA|nr:hypothetical protein TIFTF001_023304 [Ficus carica]
MPPEVGESNHIDIQPSREGGQSDEAMQPVNDSNLIILPPRPPHIPSPTVGLDLHTEYGIEKQLNLLNNDLCMAYDDCNVGKLNVADAARHSNEKSTAARIRAHSIANNTRSQYVNVPSSDSLSGSRGKEAALTSMRGDDPESYKVLPAWAEMVKRKNPASDIHIETDSENYLKYFYMCLAASKHGWPYCRPVIVVDGSALKAKFGGMLLAVCGHDANGSIFPLAFVIVLSESNESWKWFFEKLRDSIGTRESLAIVADRHKGIEYAVNLVYPDAAFGICVQHLAANLKTRYKDFKGPLKIYFDGRFYKVIASILQRTEPRPAGQFKYAVTNNAAQIWIVDMSERICTCRRFQVDQIPCPHAMAVCNHR